MGPCVWEGLEAEPPCLREDGRGLGPAPVSEDEGWDRSI